MLFNSNLFVVLALLSAVLIGWFGPHVGAAPYEDARGLEEMSRPAYFQNMEEIDNLKSQHRQKRQWGLHTPYPSDWDDQTRWPGPSYSDMRDYRRERGDRHRYRHGW